MYGVSEGPIHGWVTVPVIAALAVGLTLLTATTVVELRTGKPLLNLRLFRNRLFTASTSLYGLGSVAYLGALYLAALFLQDALGGSALRAGLVIFPSAVGVMVGSQLVTRVPYLRFGPRRIVATGLLIIATALAMMMLVGTGTSLWLVRLIMLGPGAGVSFVFVPSQAASMVTFSKVETGRASSIANAGKQLGSAVGVAFLTTVLAAVVPPCRAASRVAANLTAYHAGFLTAAAVAVIAVSVAFAIHDDAAAATMTRRPRRDAEQCGRRDPIGAAA